MSLPNNGRIAIVFCGQLRTAAKCYPNILNFIGSWLPQVDFFIHTWDYDTIAAHNLMGRDNSLLDQKIPIDYAVVDKVKEVYNPISMDIESLDEFYKKGYNFIPWIYSFIKAYEACKKHEQEKYNGYRYTLICKFRTDTLFPPGHTLDSELKYMGGKDQYFYTCDNWNALPNKVEDIKWIANPVTMDAMEEWCWERLRTDNITERHLMDWQEHCKVFMDEKKICVHAWQYNKLYHYRDLHEQMNVDINDIEMIEQVNTLRGK